MQWLTKQRNSYVSRVTVLNSVVQICRTAQLYVALQESKILCSCALLPTRVLLSSLRSKSGQGHICILACGKVKGEFQNKSFVKQVRQGCAHIIYFHFAGENLIMWPYLAAREAGNVIYTWVTMCPGGKGAWIWRSNQ